jgi:pyridoxal phosphate enzyme (YggS family)
MVKENLALCRQKLEIASQKAKISSSEIILVAVVKSVPLPLIYEGIDNGLIHIGENRVQEALLKYEPLNTYAGRRGIKILWHMVGHLQTNKIKKAVKTFDLIHSVDSFSLAAAIDREAALLGKLQDVLLQVNISGEKTKSGFNPQAMPEAIGTLGGMKNINIKGLMTIAPLVDDPKKARPYFRQLKDLRNRIDYLTNHKLTILSMGMTDDFEVAVEEGATMVRIGRGIFGERQGT